MDITEIQMSSPPQEGVTQLLIQCSDGNREAFDALLPLVYDELRRLAGYYLNRERSDHTLQSTALVHEAYLRLVDQTHVRWQNRAHFFAIASQMIRRILVDYARGHRTTKRGGGAVKLQLDDALGVPGKTDLELVALDDCLNSLAELDPKQARIVELRFFGGLSIEETAEVMQSSPATVKREWSSARAWLFREMQRGVERDA